MKLLLYKVNKNFFENLIYKGFQRVLLIEWSNDVLKISTYLAADLETVKELYNDASAAQLCGGWFNEIPSYRTKFLSVKMG